MAGQAAAAAPAPPRQPSLQVPLGPQAHRALVGLGLLGPAQLLARLRARRLAERREQPEVDVHRLERRRPGVDRLDVAAGDVVDQRPDGGRGRRHRGLLAAPLGRRHAARHQAHGRALDVALAAGDLPGEAQPRHGLQPQPRVEQPRRVDEGVAVQAAEPRELGPLQPRDGAEHLDLGAVLQLRLEAHHVVERAERVVLAELDDAVGLDERIARVGQPDRLHRPVPQRFAAALGHDLDGQAAVEIGRALPLLERRGLAGQQGVDEGLVLVAVERAVDVVEAVAAGPDLVVARLVPGLVEVDRVLVDDRRDGVEEGEVLLAADLRDGLRQPRRGQRARRHDHAAPIRRAAARRSPRGGARSAARRGWRASRRPRSRRGRPPARRRPAPDAGRRRP